MQLEDKQREQYNEFQGLLAMGLKYDDIVEVLGGWNNLTRQSKLLYYVKTNMLPPTFREKADGQGN